MQVVKNEYFSLGKPLFSFPFGFKEDFVSLKIPEKDIELAGWKITPLYNPTVSSSLYKFNSASVTAPINKW